MFTYLERNKLKSAHLEWFKMCTSKKVVTVTQGHVVIFTPGSLKSFILQ